MLQRIDFGFITATISTFRPSEGGIAEHQAVLTCHDGKLPFQQQLDGILNAYQQLLSDQLKGAVAVLKRYFLSDAANQADAIHAADMSDCAKSTIQQPPLNGTKIALWAYLMEDVTTRISDSGLYEVAHGAYRHLWNASAHNLAKNSEYQTRLLFNEYVMQLVQEGCTLKDNCIRTWLFVNDIDNNYPGVVEARNRVFFVQGLTEDTHYIASTGIGGRQENAAVLTQMDNYAIAGIKPEQIHHLYAPSRLNRTSDYGVSFERGTRVDYGDRRHVFISGTASINNKGQVVFPGDVLRQAERAWGNIEALLAEADCNFDNVMQMTVYLRDASDYELVKPFFEEHLKDIPYVIVGAHVCRPAWLIEMECMAMKEMDNKEFAKL
ncbi:MAG: hypothetical protein IKH32_03285 [Prevotella sp.]|nr:hypothetical protein [Prevotella sp.]